MSSVANKSETFEKNSWDLRWSSNTKNRNLLKIVNYDTFRVDFWKIRPYNLYFLNSDFLPNSQGALRDLTWARLQTNLSLVKIFLEISKEAHIPKIEISWKLWTSTNLWWILDNFGNLQYHNLHRIYDANLEIIKHTYIWTLSYTDVVIFLHKRVDFQYSRCWEESSYFI